MKTYPIPEIFGRNWEIIDADESFGIDFDKKIMRIPLVGDAVSSCINMQQIASIKWNDPKIALEETLLFLAVESNRLNYLLNNAEVDVSAGVFRTKDILKIECKTQRLAVLLMTDYTNLSSEAKKAYRGQVGLFNKVTARIKADPTKSNVLNIVKWLRETIKDINLNTDQIKQYMLVSSLGMPKSIEKSGLSFSDMCNGTWNELPDDNKLSDIQKSVRDQLPKDLPQSVKEYIKHFEKAGAHLTPWGRMGIDEPCRIKNTSGRFTKKWKAADEGVFPRYTYRYFVDKRIFARRCKIPGGTVLIDSSGSMYLSPQDIRKIVDCAPGCIVANYSGDNSVGMLRILAKDGRCVDDNLCSSPCGSGNIVDYPALRWAYSKSHPRIWISDLGVSGVMDEPGAGNLAMCTAIVKKGKFFHAGNVEDAVNILKKLGRYYKK